ncbi:MAG: sulfite exporter TauE/SafE family protein [Ruminiclostridium sp.]|nr:sulfite exporter TauE/SafE family protein [Ruminiclostridium sp.]
MKNKTSYIFGLLCGFLNGLFGSGGGTVAVPCLEKSGLETKKAHASSVLLIFVLSIFTSIIYFLNGNLDFSLAAQFIPYGIIGAVIGSLTLRKISSDILKKIFAVIIIISGVRILL